MHRAVRRLSSAAFRVKTEGSLRRIVIDHAARRNALTLDMYRQLPRIAAEANGGRVALLEGVGEHFSAGSDISEFATLRADSYQAEEWDAVEIKGGQFARVSWPSVMWAGWYDIFLHGHLYSFYGYQKASAPAVRGRHQRAPRRHPSGYAVS